jgi:hypothetical protein
MMAFRKILKKSGRIDGAGDVHAKFRLNAVGGGKFYFTNSAVKWLERNKIILRVGGYVEISCDPDSGRVGLIRVSGTQELNFNDRVRNYFRLRQYGSAEGRKFLINSRVFKEFINKNTDYRLAKPLKREERDFDLMLVPISADS